MIKKITLFIYLVFCPYIFFSQNNELYIEKINNELSESANNKLILEKVSNRELEKFNKTNDSLYYLSYKYALLYYYNKQDEKVKQFLTATELIHLNNKKYSIISTNVNFNIALHLENYSPELSEKFLNSAIESELKSEKKPFLPHLYHIKGRLFYNKKDYENANLYFEKALQLFKPEDAVFKASMYNNFGLVANRKEEYNKAIPIFKEGITILENQKNLSKENLEFLQLIKGNLADTYYKNNNLSEAQSTWESIFIECKKNPERTSSVLRIAKNLYDLYKKTNNKSNIEFLIAYLKTQENSNVDKNLKIYLNEILLDYNYTKNNLFETKKYSDKIIKLKDELLDDNEKFIATTSNSLNTIIINTTNEKFDIQLENQKKKIRWITTLSVLTALLLLFVYINFRNKMKLNKKRMQIEEQNKIILEKNLELQSEKNKNLHFSLNIKQETEKAFLEKLKKVRKTNATKTEEIIKDLYFELKNLISIDSKKINLKEETELANQNFTNKLSAQYPILNEQEVQLCVYFRLNLSAKEIAILEKLGVETIRVYKSRIKAKLGLTKDDSIEEFLNKV